MPGGQGNIMKVAIGIGLAITILIAFWLAAILLDKVA